MFRLVVFIVLAAAAVGALAEDSPLKSRSLLDDDDADSDATAYQPQQQQQQSQQQYYMNGMNGSGSGSNNNMSINDYMNNDAASGGGAYQDTTADSNAYSNQVPSYTSPPLTEYEIDSIVGKMKNSNRVVDLGTKYLGTTYSKKNSTRQVSSKSNRWYTRNLSNQVTANVKVIKRKVLTNTKVTVSKPLTVHHVKVNQQTKYVKNVYPKLVEVDIEQQKTIVQPSRLIKVVRNSGSTTRRTIKFPVQVSKQTRWRNLGTQIQPEKNLGVKYQDSGSMNAYGGASSSSTPAPYYASSSGGGSGTNNVMSSYGDAVSYNDNSNSGSNSSNQDDSMGGSDMGNLYTSGGGGSSSSGGGSSSVTYTIEARAKKLLPEL